MRRPFLLLMPSLLVFICGCRGLSREVNQALPEFLRADPGKEEMEIFAKVRQARDWTDEDLARQKLLVDEIRAAYDGGRFEDAADLCEAFLEQYPGSKHDEQVRYHWGDAHFRDDSYEKAFTVFQDFTALYPVSDLSPQVMELEYLMGKDFIDGKRSSFFGIFTNRSTGEKILNHVVESFPSGSRAPDAQWALARWYMEDEDWPKATAAFRFLGDHYPTSEWFAPALFYAAYCKYRQVKGAVYDPDTIVEAREGFERYLREAPAGVWRDQASAIAAELEEYEADHMYEVGDWYVGQGKEYSARYYFMNVLTRYPQTKAAQRARDSLAGISPAAVVPPPTPAFPDASEPGAIPPGGGK